MTVGQYMAQGLLFGLFFVPLVVLTHSPQYRLQPDDLAEIKLAVRHAGKTVGACTPISGAAYDQLPANMKRPEVCPRERSPLKIKLLLDGELSFHATVEASGLHSDGVASLYHRFTVPAGTHEIELLMNDDVAVDDYIWTHKERIELAPTQVLVINFKEGFQIQ